MQRALLQYKNPKNRELVLQALQKAGRLDLIGNGPKCLIKGRERGQSPRSNYVKKNNKPPIKKGN